MQVNRYRRIVFCLAPFFLFSGYFLLWAQQSSLPGPGQGEGSLESNSSAEVRIGELRQMSMKQLVESFVINAMYVDVKENKDGYLVGTVIFKKGESISATYGGEYIDVQIARVSYSVGDVTIILLRRGIKPIPGKRQFTKPLFYRLVVTKEEYLLAIEAYLKGEKHGNLIEATAEIIEENQPK